MPVRVRPSAPLEKIKPKLNRVSFYFIDSFPQDSFSRESESHFTNTL
ncbi:hypothetical protein [Rickettsiella massiliensis]|nr:hypothetical protein [Rickettsiella massiliensis]